MNCLEAKLAHVLQFFDGEIPLKPARFTPTPITFLYLYCVA